MPLAVPHNSICRCSCGTGPCNLIVPPKKQVFIDGLPVASIMDHKSGTNLPTFVLCTTLGNPAVAANNNAPVPCVPSLPSPWTPGSVNVTIRDEIILHETSTLSCTYGGIITVEQPSQTRCEVPA